CGLLGSMAVWVIMNRPHLPPKLTSTWMNNILTNVMLMVFISLIPGVSWAGHLGGGLAGALVSIPLVWSLYGRGAQRWLGWAGAAVVPAAAVLLLQQSIGAVREVAPNDPDLNKARREYAPILARIDGIGMVTYRNVAEPFLKNGKVPDAESIKDAQA